MRIFVALSAAIAAFCWIWVLVWLGGLDPFERSITNAFWFAVSSFGAFFAFIVVLAEYREKKDQ